MKEKFAGSHGPTEITVCVNCGIVLAPPLYDREKVPLVCSHLRTAVFARPERVCQELAEALREHARKINPDAPELVDGPLVSSAEFVERFGKADRGGEDG